jgi:uncharacterized protein (DUF4415 family)
MPKRRIDFSDIPELSDAQLRRMKRVGRPTIGRAPRKAVSLRVDPDVLAGSRPPPQSPAYRISR